MATGENVKTSAIHGAFSEMISKPGQFAKNNIYYVTIIPKPFSSYSKGENAANAQEISMKIKQASIPAKTLGTLDTKRFGAIFKVVNDVMNEPVTFTVICSSDYREHKYFEAWMSSIYNHSHGNAGGTDFKMKYYDDYATGSSAFISLVAPDFMHSEMVKLNEVYPQALGPVELQYGDGDVSSFTVTLAFRDWEYVT